VEAQQCVELTNTNRSRAYPSRYIKQRDISTSFRFASSFQGTTYL
jgi:hypothetical protein